MQNAISIFNFNQSQVRIQFHNGEPYFCLTDVTQILGINRRSAEAFKFNPKGCKEIATLTKGGTQQITFINEPNLYRVIFRSNKPEAVKFQDWIFEEVIPQIRKTGAYSASPKPTKDDRTGLRQAVTALVGKKHIDYSDAYTLIHQRFGVAHIDELTHSQIPQAIEYVHRLTIDQSLHGEVLDKLPEKSSAPHLSEQDLRSLNCVIRFMPYLLAYYHLTEDAVRSLNRRLCGTVHDRFSDGYLHACHLARSLNIEQQDWRDAVQEIQLHANLI